jgi:soluble lytic murein transglycosylase-like protein
MTKPSATVIAIKTSKGRASRSAPTGRLIKSSGNSIIPKVATANADLILESGSPNIPVFGLHTMACIGLVCGIALSLLGPFTHTNKHKDLGNAILANLKGNLARIERTSSANSVRVQKLSPRDRNVSHATAIIMERGERQIDPLLEKLPLVRSPEQVRLASFSVAAINKSEVRDIPTASSNMPKQREVRSPSDAIPHGSRAVVGRVHSIIKKYSPKHKAPAILAQAIVQESSRQGVDPLFVAAVIKAESTFSNTARSNKGAQGLMQIMPATGAWLRQKHDLPSGKLTDPGHNLKVGITYLKELVETYKGDRMFALVAYNWGPGHVDSATGGKRRIPKECMTYALKILGDYKRWRSGVI